MDLYAVLGVDKAATPDQIKRAYRKGAAENHPDREGGSAERMAELNDAYSVLGDAARRARYDTSGSTDNRLQQRATEMLMEVFAQVLRARGDKMAVARTIIDGMASELRARILHHNREILIFEKQKKEWCKKGKGMNLVLALLDRSIQQERDSIVGLDEMVEATEEGLRMLEEYTHTPTPAEAAQGADYVNQQLRFSGNSFRF